MTQHDESSMEQESSIRIRFSRLLFALTPLTALFLMEILNEANPFTNLSLLELVLNLVWYSIALLALRLVMGRRRLTVLVYLCLTMALGLVNHFVLVYRGRILFPQDIASWQAALNVAGEYDLSPDAAVLGAAALLGVWLLAVLLVLPPHRQWKHSANRSLTLGLGLLACIYTVVFFFTPLLPALHIHAEQWKTQSNGFLLNFTLALRYSQAEKPEDYSPETLEALTDELGEQSSPVPSMSLYSAPYLSTPYDSSTLDTESTPQTRLTVTSDPEGVQPVNIICIMDESFADLSVFDAMSTNRDSIPFYHSLTENTIKGWMYSPVTGAGTANVEYEFLTGSSTAFLPDETTAYQLYVRDGMPSLFSWAKDLGFETTAMHPYLSSGWNRVEVYRDFGADHQLYSSAFAAPSYVRGYISDQCDFERIESITDEQTGDKQFLFNVTMQNHGGYRQTWYNLPYTVTLSGALEGCSHYTEQYLNLMAETDRQLRSLIDHYRFSSEPTMIVLFGDHQGRLSSWFYENKLYQKDLDQRTLEELETMYVTPFFVWTNYPSEEASDVMISANYLGALTALKSNYPLTGFQSFLTRLYQELPVIQPIGCIDREGLLTDREDQLSQQRQKLLSDYQTLCYYDLFGWKKHRLDQLDDRFFR